MKTNKSSFAKLTLAVIAASLTIASSAFANGLVNETSDYRIYSYQFGNSQTGIVFVRKEPSIAVITHSASVGSTFTSHICSTVPRQNDHSQFKVTIPGGIN